MLSEDELNLLSRGLSFCPNPQAEPEHILITDILLFQRRCKLKYVHLTSPGKVADEHDIFHPPTGWTPKVQNRGLDSYLHAIFNQLPKLHSVRYRYNLTPNERDSLRKLALNKDLVIKPADKGGAVVLMDLADYISK